MRWYLALLCLMSFGAQAKATFELYADCANYCSFREFPNNCHGFAFKRTKDQKIDYFYTHYSDVLDACVYTRPPVLRSIDFKKAQAQCDCEHLPQLPELPAKDSPLSHETRLELTTLKDKIKQWAPCAPNPLTVTPVNDQRHFRPNEQLSCQSMQEGYMVLGGCEEGTSIDYCNYYGNTNNSAGPFCLAGDRDRCADIKLNQDPVTGAWYRSAFQRRFPLSERGQPLFSRDEVLGVMLYLAKTKDKIAAEKWMRFLDKNPKKFMTGLGKIIKVYNFCPSHGVSGRPTNISEQEWKGMQPDDRCEMRPDNWAIMYKTYRYIGFSDEDLLTISPKIFARMKALDNLTAITSLVSSLTVPANSYEAGLQATSILLLRAIGMDENSILNSAARALDQKTAHGNPYYHFLASGNRPTEYGGHLIKKFCSPEKPNYVHPPQGGVGRPAASFFDAALHTFGGLNQGWEANLPTGHDCIAWINLYLNAR